MNAHFYMEIVQEQGDTTMQVKMHHSFTIFTPSGYSVITQSRAIQTALGFVESWIIETNNWTKMHHLTLRVWYYSPTPVSREIASIKLDH